ncbi:hypothetical protein SAMN04487969_13421 [Paenibacillus algorifonticola]|uniref:Uncharacterized protein n=1 Tax=Paenibacillus algorifonticola TaxID=684063 RepID=A0A1I2IF36_9BACL|nr:hypothetical protein [Paenibacillus algorifonticola]SFF40258.1 hypothetical protein SAMN04487969_13421 [Paenibacillus algorifonticola]
MSFTIQASCPRFTDIFDRDAENLSDAIESSFPLLTENVVIKWNYVPILLSYKYDISIMIDDILEILEVIKEDSGTKTVYWASNTFAHVWHLSWDSTQLVINAEWGDIAGGMELLLQNSGNVTLKRQSFVSEWKRVLRNLITALVKSGYSEDKLPGMKRLVHEYEAIESEGNIY